MNETKASQTPDDKRSSLAHLQKHRERLLAELAVVNIDIRHILDEIQPFTFSSIQEDIRQHAMTRARRAVEEKKERTLTRAAHGDREVASILKDLMQ